MGIFIPGSLFEKTPLKTAILQEKNQEFTLAITGIKPKTKLVLNLILK